MTGAHASRTSLPFGPFRLGIAEVERVAGLRALAALVAVFAVPTTPRLPHFAMPRLMSSASDRRWRNSTVPALPRRPRAGELRPAHAPRRAS